MGMAAAPKSLDKTFDDYLRKKESLDINKLQSNERKSESRTRTIV